jgi:hypothetical protein
MHSLRKSLSETCIRHYIPNAVFNIKGGIEKIMNFFNLHPILMHFFCKVFIFMSY